MEASRERVEERTPTFTPSGGKPHRRVQRSRGRVSSADKARAVRGAPDRAPGPADMAVGEGTPPRGRGGLLAGGAHALFLCAASRLLAGPRLRRPKGGPGQGGLSRHASPPGEGRSRCENPELFPCVKTTARLWGGQDPKTTFSVTEELPGKRQCHPPLGGTWPDANVCPGTSEVKPSY